MTPEAFYQLAEELVSFAFLVTRTRYRVEDVEVSQFLADYQDGKGFLIVSRAILRKPGGSGYDYLVDQVGGPEEALKEMIASFQRTIEMDKSGVLN